MEINTPKTANKDNDQPSSETEHIKHGRKKSIVWKHFTVKDVEPDMKRAFCNNCEMHYAYSNGTKLSGTSHLKRHINNGKCKGICQKNQETPNSTACGSGDALDPLRRRKRSTAGLVGVSFDQEQCNHEIATMIIQHEYPLQIVEQPGFIEFVRTLQPQFNMVSLNTIERNCVAMYLREKQNLLNFIRGIPGRVSLTLDLWTSNQTLGYVFLRGHFIDNDWNLHRPILSVVMVPSPNSDDFINQSVVTCLSDWHLEGRVFTIALDQCFFNESLIGSFRRSLSVKNPAMLNGQLISGNCYVRVISRLAQDALWTMKDTIVKVRESVKYVKTSEYHEEKFIELKRQLQVHTEKDLLIDDQTKWNTTYYMLVAACELKDIFAYWDTSNFDYIITLSIDEWKQVETLCTYLKYLFDAANIVTRQPYPTTNAFFSELSKLQVHLTHAAMSQDPFIRNLIRPLQEKFDKYWKESCLILATAVAMDPRFKMKLVEFTFSRLFCEKAEPLIRAVDKGLHELFTEYEGMTKTPMSQEGSFEASFLLAGDGLSDFEIYISEITSQQSELDQYLEESLLPRVPEFNILSWWKLNRLNYPTLSRMASDILSIPISTLSSDSVFDTELRNLDSHRSSLRPATLEALICAKDWSQGGSLPLLPPLDVSSAT
ncbi:zinc finger BED domain-containing protein DAYSLEEPER-like [Quillaja saponaria]|uniref:Zinc finger BED domain-containing protein DAYSLEEPER-like n=1 Tax=Quillaja saponaria TaxID=32244 RepID=A0AAD7PDV4_QUISA|nr:zinc finger BED domain-containing protein DAYSLEEPER-like [Quillaja saponaria]